jgi:putative hemolysin
MSSLSLEVFFVVALILVNGVLAMAEMAVVSARKIRLQQRASEGDEKARAALFLAEDPGDFLSTVQIGISLVGILAGAFGGATIAEQLAARLSEILWLAPYSEALSVGVVVLAITYLSLVFGELVPKRLALNNAERTAATLAGPMRTLARLTSPAVRLLSFSTDLVLRLLGAKKSNEPLVTEEEVRVMIEQGTEAGVFEAAEQDMVAGVFRLGDRRVGTLITPRTEIVWLDLEDPPEVNQRKIIESVHSIFPVAEGSLDNVLGVVLAKDLLVSSLEGRPVILKDLLREPLYVPENMAALKALELLRAARLPMALVIDEYGGLQGMVTLNDILQAIVGEVSAPGEGEEPGIIQREDGSWLLDGMLPVDEFAELFDLDELPEIETAQYQTLGGFVMSHLGRIPTPGDHFEWADLRIEVMDMDGFRVDKVLVVPENPNQEEGRTP